MMVGRFRRCFSLSQANCAQAYGRAISSSGLRVLALLRDCARSDRARFRSSGGRGPPKDGIRPVMDCSMDLFIATWFQSH